MRARRLIPTLLLTTVAAAGCRKAETPKPAPEPPPTASVQVAATPAPALPPGHPPIEPGPARPLLAPGGQGAKSLVWDVPKGWISEPPANDTRRAQYKVPGTGGDAECVVFYFGAGQGGDAAANLDRWSSQFEREDGKPAEAKTRELTAGGMKVSLIETSGTYMAGSMSSAPIEKMPGWALAGAVVEGPDSNWFFKLTGPRATVSAQAGAFERMLRSVKRGER